MVQHGRQYRNIYSISFLANETVITLSIFILFFMPLKLNAQECGSNKSNWIYCTKNEDCLIISDMCGKPTAVNRQYEIKAQEFHNCQGPQVSCPAPEKHKIKSKALCKSNKCTTSFF